MRAVKSEERRLWHEATREVKRLLDRGRKHLVSDPDDGRRNQPAPAVARAAVASPTREERSEWGRIDRRTLQRLKRGNLAIAARLDLHGMTQSEAHAALARFLARAQDDGARAVLVITGRSGVLHGAVPRWLREGENRARVLAAARADTRHGGEGALYLMLRRRR